MTDLGNLRYFANVEIRRDRARGITTMKQTNYIEDMLVTYGLSDTYIKTPRVPQPFISSASWTQWSPTLPCFSTTTTTSWAHWATCAGRAPISASHSG